MTNAEKSNNTDINMNNKVSTLTICILHLEHNRQIDVITTILNMDNQVLIRMNNNVINMINIRHSSVNKVNQNQTHGKESKEGLTI